MKTFIARIAIVAGLLLASPAAQAQYRSGSQDGFRANETLFAVNYEVSGPLGDFKNYISNWSFRGWSLEGRYKPMQNVSFGVSASYNRFEQTYSMLQVPINNGTISGPTYRYADMFAIRALAHYYFMDGPIQPYVGVGIGGVWGYAYQQVADLANAQNGFFFIVDPEIGALFQLMRGSTSLNLNVAVRYTFTTFDPGRTKDAQYISPIVGLAWSY